MFRTVPSMLASILFLWSALAALCAEPAATPRVATGIGELAFRENAAQAWKHVGTGESLPVECELVVSGAGPKMVQLPGAALHLDADAHVQLNAARFEIAVQSGRVYLTVEDKAAWTLSAADTKTALKVAGLSAVQLAFQPGGEPQINWLRDAAKPRAKEGDQELVAWSREKPAQGLGQLVIKDVQSGSPVRLNVARYHANVVLQAPVALVQIDQSFYNPYPRQEEGTFIFNLPRGASVSRFAMYVTPNDLIEGELIERDRANNIYTTIVNSRRDPAILEQIGDNLFRMRVFPIFPHDIKRILLDYTVPLETDDGACRFELPLLSDLAPIWDFRLQGRIVGSVTANSFLSPSHPKLVVEKSADALVFEMRERMYQPQSNFAVSFQVPRQEGVSLHSYRAAPLPKPAPVQPGQAAEVPDPWRDREATYFLATLPPLAAPPADSAPSRADVLILADTSSGMRNRELLRRSVRTISRQLAEGDRFRLGCVDASFRPLGSEWLAPRSVAAEQAFAEFDAEFLLGATNLGESLGAAAASFGEPAAGRRRVIVYVGDGLATAGETQPVLLFDGLRKKFAAAGIQFSAVDLAGSGEGRMLLENLAAESDGALFDGLSATGRKDLFRWLLAGLPAVPRITALEISGVAADDLHYVRHLLPGRPIRVYGRSPAATELKVQCRVRSGGKTANHEWKLAVGETQDDVFIGRLWAQRSLERLMRDKESNTLREQGIKAQMIELSQEWSLLSPYTAFLVLETEADYQRWGIDRRLRRKYWKPAGQQETAPISPEWLVKIKADIVSDEQREQYTAALGKAEQAFAAGDYDAVQTHLLGVKTLPQAKSDPRYAKLSEEATQGMRRQVQGRALWRDHVLFAPREAVRESLSQPGIAPLLLGWNAAGDERSGALEFGLAREVSMPRDEMSLKEFSAWLEDVTRLTIDLDRKSLDGLGVNEKSVVPPLGRGRMSARSLANHVLRQLDLVLIQDDDRLLITTPEIADNRLKATLYPVEDLLRSERATPRNLLVPSASLQRRLAAERRLTEKLQQPISFDFRSDSLDTVVEGLAEALGENVLLDHKALHGIGQSSRSSVTCRARNIPAHLAIGRALRDLELDYYVVDEAIVIGTPEVASNSVDVRLHSGRGLIPMYPIVAGPQLGIPLWGRLRGSQTPFVTSVIPVLDGGRGFGGFGGMGMGGMGGMGGGGGGFGRSGGFGGGAGLSEDVVSIGGEGIEGQTLAANGQPDPAQQAAGNALAQPAALDPQGKPKELFEADFDTMIDTITRTITPTEWEDAGGAGAIHPFPTTLDLVVRGTFRQQFEIAKMLGELRKLPFEVASGTGGQLADPRRLAHNDGPPDFDMLIDAITSAVRPTQWEDAGGACAIDSAPNRMALVVSADEAVHEDLARLLLLLRRSKHAQEHGPHDWDRIDSGRILSGLGLTHLDHKLKTADLPEPRADELSVLECRPGPSDGSFVWKFSSAEKRHYETVLRRSGKRLEWRQSEVTCRIEGDHAALSYPDLGLVELGAWGEGARRALDDQLPWLPHRTNQELARLFEVEKATGPDALLFYVRLVPAGSPDPEGTYLRVGYSRVDRRLAHFESYVQGKLAGRLAFSDRAPLSLTQDWRRISLQDAGGREVGRWELLADKPAAGEISSLGRDWPDQIVLDLRDKEPQVERDFHAAVAAIESRDWLRARQRLNVLIEERPKLPLLRLLRAWCLDHEQGPREQMISDLTLVAQSNSVRLTRFISAGGFASLSPEALFQVLSQQAAASLSLDDRERLAQAALAAGRTERALEVIRDSLSAPEGKGDDPFGPEGPGGRVGPSLLRVSPFDPNDSRFYERFKLLIDALARLNRDEMLGDLLDKFISQRATGGVVSSLADLLAARNKRGLADAMLVKFLSSHSLSSDQRVALLRKRAELQPNLLQRSKLRLTTIHLLPASSAERHAETELLLAELQQPTWAEVVEQVAEATHDAPLRARLWVRQAELEERRELAAELVWRAYLAGSLPAAKTLWACERLNAAEQPVRVIRLCEAQLRKGETLAPAVLAELSRAYRAARRPTEAQRAGVQDPTPPAPRPVSRGPWGAVG